MDADVKQAFIDLSRRMDTHNKNISDKLDSYIKYHKDFCNERHNPVNTHLNEFLNYQVV